MGRLFFKSFQEVGEIVIAHHPNVAKKFEESKRALYIHKTLPFIPCHKSYNKNNYLKGTRLTPVEGDN